MPLKARMFGLQEDPMSNTRWWIAAIALLAIAGLPSCGGGGGDGDGGGDGFIPAVILQNMTPYTLRVRLEDESGARAVLWQVPANGTANVPHDAWQREEMPYFGSEIRWTATTTDSPNPCGALECDINFGTQRGPANEADTVLFTIDDVRLLSDG